MPAAPPSLLQLMLGVLLLLSAAVSLRPAPSRVHPRHVVEERIVLEQAQEKPSAHVFVFYLLFHLLRSD